MFDATRTSQTYRSNFPPLSGADVSIPAPSISSRSSPPLETPFSEWLNTTFPARPQLLPVATSSNLKNTDVTPEITSLISPPPPKKTPRSTCTPRTSRRSRRTERSRRFAERRLEKFPPSRPQSAIIPSSPSSPDLLQPIIVKGSDIMSTAAKTKILREILDLPNVPASLENSPRPPELNAKARSFSPTPCPSPSPHHPDPCPSVLGVSPTPFHAKETSRVNPPFVSPTPSKMGGRLLFPTQTPAEKSLSPPPLPSSPPLPSLFTTGGHPRNTTPPTFPRPTPNSGLHQIPPSPNMGGQFPNQRRFPRTPSSSSHFFPSPSFNVLHPYILQNIFDHLQSINFFLTSVLTPIPVLLHPSPYGSNS